MQIVQSNYKRLLVLEHDDLANHTPYSSAKTNGHKHVLLQRSTKHRNKFKIRLFWNATPCSLLHTELSVPCCLSLQCRPLHYPDDENSSYSKSRYPIFQTTCHYILTQTLTGILKDSEKLKSHIKVLVKSLGLITGYAIRTESEVVVQFHAFLTSASENMRGQHYNSVASVFGRKVPGTH